MSVFFVHFTSHTGGSFCWECLVAHRPCSPQDWRRWSSGIL